jgi:hypothetical protein
MAVRALTPEAAVALAHKDEKTHRVLGAVAFIVGPAVFACAIQVHAGKLLRARQPESRRDQNTASSYFLDCCKW